MNTSRKIIISFDVEEFDLPLEYGRSIDKEEQLLVGYTGLQNLLPILKERTIPTTLFTTAFFAEAYPELIHTLSRQHEIASHTYYHSSFQQSDLLLSKRRLEQITGKEVVGLRMPRMTVVSSKDVKDAGYKYNSSINPTWIPGRYNNLHSSRLPFRDEGIVQVPVSVTPHLRFPLFWLSFKNLPYSFYLRLATRTLRKDGYLLLYFHPWEFTDLSKYNLPNYIKRGGAGACFTNLHRLINDLSTEGQFCSLQRFLKC